MEERANCISRWPIKVGDSRSPFENLPVIRLDALAQSSHQETSFRSIEWIKKRWYFLPSHLAELPKTNQAGIGVLA